MDRSLRGGWNWKLEMESILPSIIQYPTPFVIPWSHP